MNLDRKVLDKLLKLAEKAYKNCEIPVSAVIVDKEGNLVSSSCNNRQNDCNVLGHAEINCILKAEKKIHDWRLNGYSMVVTLEPCDMCSMIIKESRLDNVYYFVSKSSENIDVVSVDKFIINDYPEYTKKFKDLLTRFFDNMR